MAVMKCQNGHTVEDPELQCQCGCLPPHKAEGDVPQSPRVCSRCGIPVAREDDACWECGVVVDQSEPAVGAVAVRLVVGFPWGDWRHPGGIVLVGRDRDSPLAGSLETYLGVSRRHAFLSNGVGGSFVSEDPENRSKHGTFVDGQRVEPGEQVPLVDGNILRLGVGLSARIIRLDGS